MTTSLVMERNWVGSWKSTTAAALSCASRCHFTMWLVGVIVNKDDSTCTSGPSRGRSRSRCGNSVTVLENWYSVRCVIFSRRMSITLYSLRVCGKTEHPCQLLNGLVFTHHLR